MTKIKMMNLYAIIAMCMSYTGGFALRPDSSYSPDPVMEAVSWAQQRVRHAPSSISNSSSTNSLPSSTTSAETAAGIQYGMPSTVLRPFALQISRMPWDSVPADRFTSLGEERTHSIYTEEHPFLEIPMRGEGLPYERHMDATNPIFYTRLQREMESSLKARDDKINALVGTIAQLQSRLDVLERQKVSTPEESSQKRKLKISVSPQNLREVEERLQTQLDDNEQEILALREDIDDKASSITVLLEKVEFLGAALQDRDERITDLQAQLEEADADRNGLSGKLLQLENQVATLRKQLHSKPNLQAAMEKLQEQILGLNTRIDDINKGKREKATNFQKLESAVKTLKTQLSELSGRQNAHDEVIEDIETTTPLLAEQITLLQKSLQLLQHSVEVLNANSKDNISIIQGFKAQLDEIQTSFKEIMEVRKQELEQKDAIIQQQTILLNNANDAVRKMGASFQDGIRRILTTIPSKMTFPCEAEQSPCLFEMMERNLGTMWRLPEDCVWHLLGIGATPHASLPFCAVTCERSDDKEKLSLTSSKMKLSEQSGIGLQDDASVLRTVPADDASKLPDKALNSGDSDLSDEPREEIEKTPDLGDDSDATIPDSQSSGEEEDSVEVSVKVSKAKDIGKLRAELEQKKAKLQELQRLCLISKTQRRFVIDPRTISLIVPLYNERIGQLKNQGETNASFPLRCISSSEFRQNKMQIALIMAAWESELRQSVEALEAEIDHLNRARPDGKPASLEAVAVEVSSNSRRMEIEVYSQIVVQPGMWVDLTDAVTILDALKRVHDATFPGEEEYHSPKDPRKTASIVKQGILEGFNRQKLDMKKQVVPLLLERYWKRAGELEALSKKKKLTKEDVQYKKLLNDSLTTLNQGIFEISPVDAPFNPWTEQPQTSKKGNKHKKH